MDRSADVITANTPIQVTLEKPPDKPEGCSEHGELAVWTRHRRLQTMVAMVAAGPVCAGAGCFLQFSSCDFPVTILPA